MKRLLSIHRQWRILMPTMSDDQFTKLYTLLRRDLAVMQDDLKAHISKVGKQVDGVYQLFDANLSDHERQEHERAAAARQLDRHEKWLQQLATHTGATLHYE